MNIPNKTTNIGDNHLCLVVIDHQRLIVFANQLHRTINI